MKNLTAAAALSTLVACGYKEDPECFDRAERTGLDLDAVRMMCSDGAREIRNRVDDCHPVERNGRHLDFTFNFADVNRAPEDTKLVAEYSCGGFGDVNSGTSFYETSSGSTIRVASSTLEAVGCFDEDTITVDLYVVDYGSRFGECDALGHWEVSSFPDGRVIIREEDAAGWNEYKFDAQ